ncbi:MAG: DUF1146 domain-containing protein [Erysipelotrichaceae bacterium]|nr:DUF1146 domain-containing protein [Erysipelotrichaceae bacterium]
MIYYLINITVYIVSVIMAMIGLSCFHFDRFIREGRMKEFYVFYLMASVGLGYLFASFILNFTTWSSLL